MMLGLIIFVNYITLVFAKTMSVELMIEPNVPFLPLASLVSTPMVIPLPYQYEYRRHKL